MGTSTGAAWRDLPERYGPWKTVYERFRRWSADGTWDRLLAHVQQHSDAVGAVDWTVVCVDSTTVRDGEGRPLAFTLTAGNVNDCIQFEQVMARIPIQRCGPGRPKTRPERVAADKGYSSMKVRTYLRRHGIKAPIPDRIDQINGRIRRARASADSTGRPTGDATSSSAASTSSSTTKHRDRRAWSGAVFLWWVWDSNPR